MLLTLDGTPKITDFGLAKRLDDDSTHTQTGEILGTPAYMAPEQAEGRRGTVGPHTDVFALGAILYEMLTGQSPFKGASPLETLHSVVQHDPTPPRSVVSLVPRDLEAICLKCLEKKPTDRYKNAQELADDLHRFEEGLPVRAARSGIFVACGEPSVAIRRWSRSSSFSSRLPVAHGVDVPGARAEQERLALAERRAPQVREILTRNCLECHGAEPRRVGGRPQRARHRSLVRPRPEDRDPRQPRRLACFYTHRGWIDAPRGGRALAASRDAEGGGHLGGVDPRRGSAVASRGSGQPDFAGGALLAVGRRGEADLPEEVLRLPQVRCRSRWHQIFHHRLLLSIRKVVVPYQPDKSVLYETLVTEDLDKRMPPEDYDSLTPLEIDKVRTWIEQGAHRFQKVLALIRRQGIIEAGDAYLTH